MVKRTLFVLGILSIAVMLAGTSFAFNGLGKRCGNDGWCNPEWDVWVPAPCVPYPVGKRCVSEWSAHIELPYPCGGMGFGRGCGSYGLLRAFPDAGLVARFLNVGIGPLDLLFAGGSGVEGCTARRGGDCALDCGPLPGLVRAPVLLLSSPITIFGGIF